MNNLNEMEAAVMEFLEVSKKPVQQNILNRRLKAKGIKQSAFDITKRLRAAGVIGITNNAMPKYFLT